MSFEQMLIEQITLRDNHIEVMLAARTKEVDGWVTRFDKAVGKQQHIIQKQQDRIAELEKRLIAPTNNGIDELDQICGEFNNSNEANLTELVCDVFNKATYLANK